MVKKKRFLIGKRLRSQTQAKLSHDEVNAAIRNFQQSGGLIQELPPQEDTSRNNVGCRLDTPYEVVMER